MCEKLLLVLIAVIPLAGCGQGSSLTPGFTRTVEHDLVSFDVSPDGEKVVFSSATGDLYLLALGTLELERLTATTALETQPSYSPDGGAVVFASSDGDSATGKGTSQIELITLIDNKRTRLTDGKGVFDACPAYSADGQRIVFIRAHRNRDYSMGGRTWDDWDVYTMQSDGGNLKRHTDQKQNRISGAIFTQNQESILYTAEGDRNVSKLAHTVFEVKGAADAKPSLLSADMPKPGKYGAWASAPNLSPDGRQLVFISDRANAFDYDIVLLDLQTSKSRALNITNVSEYNGNPVFEPDGTSVYFLAGTEKGSGNRSIFSLWRVDIDSGKTSKVADSGLFTNPINWANKRE